MNRTSAVQTSTQAVSAVSGTLAVSIESTIESVVGEMLAEFIAKQGEPE